jgi:hypothetical protein
LLIANSSKAKRQKCKWRTPKRSPNRLPYIKPTLTFYSFKAESEVYAGKFPHKLPRKLPHKLPQGYDAIDIDINTWEPEGDGCVEALTSHVVIQLVLEVRVRFAQRCPLLAHF